ncbi:IS256 family transposase [Aliarcobacter skirrowii]|uniref:IS256 family transposase n=1 Tax=Aliarcobacter skirrowii TaxID=28200 RepID=UPI000D617333|nr:IS256 family transposase [Aliarcobacter skirrowii]PWE18989.1 IS256 family transposase [Aliarcobacter skirrowii]PWE24058.1 IS256 family transposase [Aliarcobacter skirrowii]RJO54957.1 IS256 family transposase [Aliarcobacter skirrowii]RJO56913.1 IS256 family transposase [Aliarcobacter skirrowii]
MNILNKEELRRQIREGKEISLDGILEEFKSLLRESLQTASEEELTSHLGYEKHQESENTNYRNGHSKKSLKTKYGQIDVAIPRDREGTFEPKLVPKRERILKGSEELILSLYAKGMSVADISTHLDDLYGYQLSEQTISNITEAIMDKAKEWQNRPLEAIYPIVFMDATVLKIRVDRVVKNIAAYIMLGITLEGKKEILGIWIGENETSKYWLTLLNELKNRGVEDILIFAIDGLNGFNQAIQAVYPKAEIQRCIVHQIRSSLKFVSWKDRKAVAKDLKTIYTAKTEEDAQLALTEFNDIWGSKYPHILQSWLNNWNELATFFKYPKSIQTLIYTTNPIESLNANIKRKTNSKGSFPTIDSAFKMLYMSTQEVQAKWERTSMRNWSEIYPQLCIFFSEIMEKYTK